MRETNIETDEIIPINPHTPRSEASDATGDLESDGMALAHAEKAMEFVDNMKRVLLENDMLYREDLSRDDISRVMNVSNRTVTENVKIATGERLTAYINDLRLEHSAELLSTSDFTVEQVLYECGFSSRSTFYRAFLKKYGYPASEHRSRISQSPE